MSDTETLRKLVRAVGDNAVADLVRNALDFANRAAGEGIEIDGLSPEDFLMKYSVTTGDEDWDTLTDRILDDLTPSPEAQSVETLAKDASEEDAINYHVKQAVNSLWPVFGGNHMEAEFWEGLSQLMRGIISSENPAQFLRDRSEPYHPPAPQPEAPAAQEWHREDNDHSILLYTLKEDRLRNGKPIMVNDLTIRIENANRSTNDLSVVTDAILAALSAAGRKEGV